MINGTICRYFAGLNVKHEACYIGHEVYLNIKYRDTHVALRLQIKIHEIFSRSLSRTTTSWFCMPKANSDYTTILKSARTLARKWRCLVTTAAQVFAHKIIPSIIRAKANKHPLIQTAPRKMLQRPTLMPRYYNLTNKAAKLDRLPFSINGFSK